MTLINCKLNDSGSAPLTGFVRVIADYIITDDATGIATLPVPSDTQLVNGQCQLNLEDSDLARVTYKFEVWQVTATTTGIIWTFNARVPASLTPINLTDLVATGITKDALDTGLLAVSRRILADDNFWTRLKSDVLTFKGAYSPTTYYRKGDAVVYQGSSYVMVYDGIVSNQIPVNNATYWLLFAAKGEQPTSAQGDNTSYDASSWANSMNAPTKNAVRDRLEQLAPKDGAILANAVVANNWLQTDNSKNVTYTSWVTEKVNAMRGLANADAKTLADAAQTYANQYTDSINTSVRQFATTLDTNQAADILAKYNDALDRLPSVFRDSSLLTGTSVGLTANVWTDIAAQNIVVKARGSAAIAINGGITVDQNATQALTLRYQLVLNNAVSNEHTITLQPNLFDTRSMYHVFSGFAGGNYSAKIRIKADLNSTWNIRLAYLFTTVF